jgi:hypothetical protein
MEAPQNKLLVSFVGTGGIHISGPAGATCNANQ